MSRSKWKGPFFKTKNLRTVEKTQEFKRNFEIIPKFVGQSVMVHTGKKFIKIILTEDMILNFVYPTWT